MSKIIFLNGCSSAGKSSISKEIMELSRDPWLNFSLSIFWNALSPKYRGFGEKSSTGFQFVLSQDEKGFPVNEIKFNSYGKKILDSMPRVFKQLAEDGHNLIIEEVISEQKYLKNYESAFKNHKAYFINVACDLPTLEKREKARGDRIVGTNRAQFVRMNDLEWKYELKVDTTQISPSKNAEKILKLVESNNPVL